MNITINQAVRNDAPVIVDFQLKMAMETESIELDKAVVVAGVNAVFEDPSKGFYLLVKSQQDVIACMLLTPEWSDWRNKTFLWIQSLYVIPAFRKKGVFKQLYEYVQLLVNNSSAYAGLKLYVDKNNLPAQEVYNRVGMEKSHYLLYEWNKLEF